MKIFNDPDTWASKVNFVDDNNVVLGYDMSQDCCEHADWFIHDKITTDLLERPSEEQNYDGWQFDPDFFQQVQSSNLDEGGMVVFRIVKDDGEKFIHIFNSHNGYYGHGFYFKVGGEIVQNDTL